MPTLSAFDAPVKGGFHQNIAMPFGAAKLEWLGYQVMKKNEDMFICFHTIHERDRQTDTHRQTPHDGIGRAYA